LIAFFCKLANQLFDLMNDLFSSRFGNLPRPLKEVLRPKDPVVLENLAQTTRPRETQCKTSCAKCFVKLTFILCFN